MLWVYAQAHIHRTEACFSMSHYISLLYQKNRFRILIPCFLQQQSSKGRFSSLIWLNVCCQNEDLFSFAFQTVYTFNTVKIKQLFLSAATPHKCLVWPLRGIDLICTLKIPETCFFPSKHSNFTHQTWPWCLFFSILFLFFSFYSAQPDPGDYTFFFTGMLHEACLSRLA